MEKGGRTCWRRGACEKKSAAAAAPKKKDALSSHTQHRLGGFLPPTRSLEISPQ